jgi:hypothetical protein
MNRNKLFLNCSLQKAASKSPHTLQETPTSPRSENIERQTSNVRIPAFTKGHLLFLLLITSHLSGNAGSAENADIAVNENVERQTSNVRIPAFTKGHLLFLLLITSHLSPLTSHLSPLTSRPTPPAPTSQHVPSTITAHCSLLTANPSPSTTPVVNHGRLRFPKPGVVNPGQIRQRTVFRGHRHIIVGFR